MARRDSLGRRIGKRKMRFWGIPYATAFWLRVWPRGDCWEWRGSRTQSGYGLFGMFTYGRVLAHRVAYEYAKGQIPQGMEISHRCQHPWCVRPSHLEVVTHRENMLFGTNPTAQRARQTHCKRGHEYTEENTIWRPKKGLRQCRTCTYQQQKDRMKRLRKQRSGKR